MNGNKALRKYGLFAAAAIVGLAVAPVSAPAAGLQCLEHERMTKLLGKKFQEKRRAFGLFNSAGMMELYVGAKGTWTVLLIRPSGISCILAAGHTWEDLPIKVSGPAV